MAPNNHSPEVVTVNTSNRLEHMESSIESAQGLLDRAQKVVTGLDTAHQRVERTAGLLRQATVALIIGCTLLAVLAVLRRTR
jgi:hypothetical protein